MENEQPKNPDDKKNPAPPTGSSLPGLITILIVSVLLSWFLFRGNSRGQEISWQTFEDDFLSKKEVEKIDVINREIAEVYIKKEKLTEAKHKEVATDMWGGENEGPHYFFTIGSPEIFEKKIDEAQNRFGPNEKINITYSTKVNWWSDVLAWIIPLVLIGLFWFFIIRRMSMGTGRAGGGSVFDFGKSKPAVYEKGKLSPITFKDVAGYDEAKMEIMEIVEFLKNPGQFTRLGAKIPKGVLLVGAPGTGKTLMAKAVAGEAGVPFFSLSGSEFIEMFVGVGASRVRDLFNRAKQKAPSIIFIDEIDTVGKIRGKALSMQANDERESTLNQLLAEMDGFDSNTNVIVMGATNRADILDPALLRPGRFDRHIQLDLPNKNERLEIFKVHLKPLVHDASLDMENLAAQTPGFSGADISNVCNEAALIAARKKKNTVERQDFYDAIDRVIAGLEKKSKIISATEKKIIAWHEAGHAVVSWMLKHADQLQKVSIIPRGKSLGAAWYLPEERQIITRSQFMDRISAALGGRVAEEIVFEEISSGALDDLEKVTKQAYMMVANLGLSDKIGPLSFYDSTGQTESAFQKPYSEATAKMIDDEVRAVIALGYGRTKDILVKNREKLDELAQLLLDKEIIYKEEMEAILGPRTPKEEPVLA